MKEILRQLNQMTSTEVQTIVEQYKGNTVDIQEVLRIPKSLVKNIKVTITSYLSIMYLNIYLHINKMYMITIYPFIFEMIWKLCMAS